MPDAGLGALFEAALPALGEGVAGAAGGAADALPFLTGAASGAADAAPLALTVGADTFGPALGAGGEALGAGASGFGPDLAALAGGAAGAGAGAAGQLAPDIANSFASADNPTFNERFGGAAPQATGNVSSISSGSPVTTAQAPQVAAMPAGPGAASTAAPAGVSGEGLDLTSLFKTGKDWLGPIAAAGGLGYQVLQGEKQTDATKAIANQATTIGKQAQPLIDQGTDYTKYLASGTLPPAMQAQVDQQTHDAKAAITSRYASMGLPTDPLKNSQLQAELASVDDKARQMTASLGNQLLQGGTSMINSGANLTGMDSNLLTTLQGIDKAQSDAIGKAIANFASALGNASRPGVKTSGTGTTIQIG